MDVEAAGNVQEVDTTGDVASSPAPGYPAVGGDDEDDNDFLARKAETVPFDPAPGVGDEPVRGESANAVIADERQDAVVADVPPAPDVPTDTPDLPRRRGKRSGRGAD